MTRPYFLGVRRLLALSYVLAVANAIATKLIVYAGPHKAASTAIEEFFYENASGHARVDDDGTKVSRGERNRTFGLRYWLWPRIAGELAASLEPYFPYKIFGHLVTDHSNDVLTSVILDGIKESWNSDGIEGLILGSEVFDQVGPYVEYDATLAVSRIVDYLEVPPNDVTVVLNYRTPRLDQWASMWKHDAVESSAEGEDFAYEYKEWLCDIKTAEEHIQVLATQMNPLNAAEAYANLGFNVKLIDMEGVKEAGRDIVHVVACDIATAKCDDGVVRNHEEDDLQKNSIQIEFSGLTEIQRVDAELLFQYRDCAYKDLRTNVKFGVLYNHSIWADCDEELAEIYQRLKDEPKFMYEALVDQMQCPNKDDTFVSMKNALTGIKETKSDGNGDFSTDGRGSGGGIGGFFLELAIFIGIFAGAMSFQYIRMAYMGPLRAGAYNMRSTAPMGSLEEVEGQFTNDVAAEYGDAESDSEEDLSSGLRTT